MNYEKEDQAMPEEELFDKIDSKTAKISGKKSNKKDKREKKTAKVKVQSLVQKNEIKRELNDAIYYEKLNEEKPDLAKPLQKGSVDMWFLLWAMILLCFGIVMCYSAGVVDAV